MPYKLSDVYNTFRQVRDFGAKYEADFPAGSRNRLNFDIVAASIAAIETSGAIKESGAAKQGTTLKELAALAVMEEMRRLNKTARGLAVDNPSVIQLFRMPAGDSFENLIETAEAHYKNAVALKQDFLESDVPENFLDDFRADIDALKEAATEKNERVGERIGATAASGTAVGDGLKAVRRLRGSVPNKCAGNPAKLAEWESASHIETPSKKKPPTP
jgi:hypothetical protein